MIMNWKRTVLLLRINRYGHTGIGSTDQNKTNMDETRIKLFEINSPHFYFIQCLIFINFPHTWWLYVLDNNYLLKFFDVILREIFFQKVPFP